MKFAKTDLIRLIDNAMEETKKAHEEQVKTIRAEVAEAQAKVDDFLAGVSKDELFKQFEKWVRASGSMYILARDYSIFKEVDRLPIGKTNYKQDDAYYSAMLEEKLAGMKADKNLLTLSEGTSVTINSVNSRFGKYLA